MPPKWQRPLISARKAEIADVVRDVIAADDLDLYEEVADKLAEIMRVYRRSQETAAMFRFVDGHEIRLIDMWPTLIEDAFGPESDDADD